MPLSELSELKSGDALLFNDALSLQLIKTIIQMLTHKIQFIDENLTTPIHLLNESMFRMLDFIFISSINDVFSYF